MLTDAEMQRLLDARAEAGDALSYMLGDCAPHVEAYIKALDAALPWMVEEIRRLDKKLYEAQLRWAKECYVDPLDEPPMTEAEKLADYDRRCS